MLDNRKYFEALGDRIGAAWRQAHLDIDAFPKVVMDVVDIEETSQLYTEADVVSVVEDPYTGAIQTPSLFSDVNLRVYDDGKFFIELLNWNKVDTSIHDHNFSGVQIQLVGRALNVNYGFDTTTRISESFGLGSMSISGMDLMGPGDHRLIPPGTADKHAVYHLDRPTISMIIRTHPSSVYSPQRVYFPETLQADYGFLDVRHRKAVRGFKYLMNTNKSAFADAFRKSYLRASLPERYWLISDLRDHVFNGVWRDLLMELVEASEHSEIEMEFVKAVLFTKKVEMLIHRFKPNCETDDQRYLLTLLASTFSEDSFSKGLAFMERERGEPLDLAAVLASFETVLDRGNYAKLRTFAQMVWTEPAQPLEPAE